MRSLSSFITLPLTLSCALAGCASPVDVPDESAGTEQAALVGTGDGYTYFGIAADLRKCPSPTCGGWFLTQLNRPFTRCHDGTISASCYTPVLDWTNAGLSDAQAAAMLDACNQAGLSTGVYAIVRGQFARTNTTPQPSLGRFVIREAWVAEGEVTSAGTFVRVEDNGLRCFVAPCPNLTETTLNMGRIVDIAGVDWTPSGMSEAVIEECTQDMFAPDGLLVAGDRYMMTENSTTAKGRTVTNAYERLVPQ
jgi:hypothetical protein